MFTACRCGWLTFSWTWFASIHTIGCGRATAELTNRRNTYLDWIQADNRANIKGLLVGVFKNAFYRPSCGQTVKLSSFWYYTGIYSSSAKWEEEVYIYTKSPARTVQTSTILVLSSIYPPLLWEIKSDKPTSNTKEDVKVRRRVKTTTRN